MPEKRMPTMKRDADALRAAAEAIERRKLTYYRASTVHAGLLALADELAKRRLPKAPPCSFYRHGFGCIHDARHTGRHRSEPANSSGYPKWWAEWHDDRWMVHRPGARMAEHAGRQG